MSLPIRLTCFLSLCVLNASAATFTVTPNVVSNDYTGLIAFQMNGLSPGETVEVAQVYDFNGNGVVDGPDLAVFGGSVTDGELKLLGGATNVNVLRDEDGTADGSIRGSLRFAFAPEMARAVGSYMFSFSNPSNHFPATNVPFKIISAPYAQKFQGVVKSNGTNVPYAAVGLVQVGAGPTGFAGIIGGTADATGNYTLNAPPDTYWVIAFWRGYVTDFNAAPHLALAPGATITTNLNLIAATTTLAGTLVDSNDPSLPALPYGQITLFNTNLFFTIVAVDRNAAFNVAVTPGSWTIRASWQSAVAKSYLVSQPGNFNEAHFDTSTGPVTGAAVAFKRATALIYGTVYDNNSNAIPDITLSANADGGAFDAFGISDTNGVYALAIDAGGGFVEVQDLTGPPANKYLWTGVNFGISDGQARNIDVIGIVPTAHFRGHLLDDTGAPVNDFEVFATGANTKLGGTSLATTDINGLFDLRVFGGNWQLNFESQGTPDLVFPLYSFKITDGIDVTNNIIIPKATGNVSGYVRNQSGGGIQGLTIKCTTSVGSTNYSLSAYTDPGGNYSFTVFNGTWTISPDPNSLQYQFGFTPANPTNVVVPPANAVANFIVTPILPPQITTAKLPDATVGKFYLLTLAGTNGVEPYSWSISAGALPDGLELDSSFGELSGKANNAGLFNFTVKATDSRGGSGTSDLSIRVRSSGTGPQAPTLDLPTLLPGNLFSVRVTGTAGQGYTLEFATGLTNWTDSLTMNAPSDLFYLQDTNTTNVSRFYRVKVNP